MKKLQYHVDTSTSRYASHEWVDADRPPTQTEIDVAGKEGRFWRERGAIHNRPFAGAGAMLCRIVDVDD